MKKVSLILVFGCFISLAVFAQKGYVPSAANLKNRDWFENSQMGLMFTFGAYTQLNDSDEAWAMRKYTLPQYKKLIANFDPKYFNAKEWVTDAKALGFSYIVILTKHHDGFCLFDSKYTNWTIMHYGKYHHDIIKALAEECHKQGIKLFLYYSLLDWHHPDFVFHKEDGGVYQHRTPNPKRDENKYIQYVKNQLTELLTNYGKIDGIWFDGYWSKNTNRWPFEKIYGLIHRLQPACMIGNNHDMFYIPGEDYAIYALYAKFPSADYDIDPRLKKIPLQAMDKTSDKWGYYSKQVYKPVYSIMSDIKRAAGRHASLMLNTSPLPNGEMDPHFIDSMKIVHRLLLKQRAQLFIK